MLLCIFYYLSLLFFHLILSPYFKFVELCVILFVCLQCFVNILLFWYVTLHFLLSLLLLFFHIILSPCFMLLEFCVVLFVCWQCVVNMLLLILQIPIGIKDFFDGYMKGFYDSCKKTSHVQAKRLASL